MSRPTTTSCSPRSTFRERLQLGPRVLGMHAEPIPQSVPAGIAFFFASGWVLDGASGQNRVEEAINLTPRALS